MSINNPASYPIPFLKRIYLEPEQESGTPSFFPLLLRISILLVTFMFLEWAILRSCRLDQSQYASPFLALELGKNLIGIHLVILLPALGILLVNKSFWQPWSSVGTTIRILITFTAAIMAWAFSTYDYNLYFNQGHYGDRVCLLVLLMLLCWRPVFLLPFILELITIIMQFKYPLGGYSVAEQFLLVRILILFLAMFILFPLVGKGIRRDFVFITITLVASSYFWPGYGKMRLNWIAHGHIYQLLFGTYANGWLAFLPPDTIVTMGKIYSWFDWPMIIGTLILEFGAIFALWHRNGLRVFLCGWAFFHLGVVSMSGIFFWKWILLDALLFILFVKKTYFSSLPIFKRSHFLVSILLIGGCNFWFNPVNLAWYDTRINYAHRFFAVDAEGNEYSLSKHFFAPYDYQFTVSAFRYLSKEPRLRVTWGATWNADQARALRKARTPEDIYALEAKMGKVRHNPSQITRLDQFLIKFFTNLNARGSKKTWLSWFKAPPQLLTFPSVNPYTGQAKIEVIKIYQITSLYDEAQYIEFRRQLVHELKIPPASKSH